MAQEPSHGLPKSQPYIRQPMRVIMSPVHKDGTAQSAQANSLMPFQRQKIAERTKLSPLVGAWYSELGGLNKWCHIWAYKDAGERFRIREEARAKGIWPPKGGQPGMMLKQENMLVVPASFSPLR